MAALLEPLLIPRASAHRTSFSPPVESSPVSAVSRCRKSGSLSESRGLRIDPRFQKLALVSAMSGTAKNTKFARRGIVCEAQETAVEAVPAVTATTWQSLVLESSLPTLVEFWAPWCGPCRMIHPVIDELSKLYAGKLTCLKLNTDESPSIATQYGIRSIPTIIIFKNGEKKETIIGAVPKTTLTLSIEKFL